MRRSSFSRWYGIGRVLLFFVVCAILLLLASSQMPKQPGFMPQVALGIVTSLAAWFFTWIFCRWDGVRLSDVGAMPRIQSLHHLLFGAVLGTALVAVQAFFLVLVVHAHWTRVPNTSVGRVYSIGCIFIPCLSRRAGLPWISIATPGEVLGSFCRTTHCGLSLFSGTCKRWCHLGERLGWRLCWIAALWHGGACHARTCGSDRASCDVELWAMGLGRERIAGVMEGIDR